MTERLRTLKDLGIVFTGRLSVVREKATRAARKAGANVGADVSGTTDVLVQGEPSPNYKWGNVGIKLAEVASRRREGQRIWVINEPEFDRLRSYKGLTVNESRAAESGVTTDVGVAWRQPAKSAGNGISKTIEVDLTARDRATRRHHLLVRRLGRVLEKSGLHPLDPVTKDCWYDLAWERSKSVWVAEAKTLSNLNEVQQIRLGIGQLLDYRTRLRLRHPTKTIRMILVVSRRPVSDHLIDVCDEVQVEVVWPDVFASLTRGI